MPSDVGIDDPHTFTSSSTAITLKDLETNMRTVEAMLAKHGPPKCMVILPNGEFHSGTMEQMSTMLLLFVQRSNKMWFPTIPQGGTDG